MPPLGFIHFFYCITQGGAVHFFCMLVKLYFENVYISFAHLA